MGTESDILNTFLADRKYQKTNFLGNLIKNKKYIQF